MDVLLYSKFSNSSKKLMSQLQKTPDLLNSLTLTCIDNKQIRDQILSDQKVKVNVLPCLIRLNETSENFDIYEGQNAFDFFTSLQTEMKLQEQMEVERNQEMKLQDMRMQEMKLQEMKLQEMKLQEMKLQEMKLQEMKLQEMSSKSDKEKDKLTEDILRNAKRQESERHTSQNKLEEYKNPLKQKISTSLSSEPVTFTTIDDLGLNDEEDGEVAINTYVHVEKNSNSENSERDVSSKKAETSVKGNSLLSKAMQMQKERN